MQGMLAASIDASFPNAHSLRDTNWRIADVDGDEINLESAQTLPGIVGLLLEV